MRKLAFTLAEVLITLVIIGVVSAITVPTLMNNTNGKEYSTKFKKSISAMNQALSTHYALDGLTARDYSSDRQIIEDLFKKRMNVMEKHKINRNYILTDHTDTKLPVRRYDHFITQDGIVYILRYWQVESGDELDGDCNILNTKPCTGGDFNLVIDVNGEQGPNKLTTNSRHPKDVYLAQIFNQKVVPYGSAAQEVMYDKPTVHIQDTSIRLPEDHEEE